MTVKHLRIFVTVYREMNITHASETLHMTQPAVTRAIQELEGYYGIRLFERMGRRLCRTGCGEELYARAIHIIDSFDEMECCLRSWDESGELRVGASITLGNFLLPKLVKTFQTQHPDLKIHAVVSKLETIQQNILDNKIDLGVVEGELLSDSVHTECFTQDALEPIVPPGHPLLLKDTVFLQDLLACPLLLRDRGSAGRAFLDHVFAAHGHTVRPVWESMSTQALVNATAAGIGISILPKQLVAQDIASGKVSSLRLSDETFTRNNYIVWHRQKYLTGTMLEFIGLCRTLHTGITAENPSQAHSAAFSQEISPRPSSGSLTVSSAPATSLIISQMERK